MIQPRPRILCVDDEQHVLDGLSRVLHRDFEVVTATGGGAGLHQLQGKPGYAVVLCDMRMPGADGVAVLRYAREQVPDATRILLTGQADTRAAIDAINEGRIFRFLTKPCRPKDLELALWQGVEQHRLVTGERELLERTLTGSVQALIEMLALTNPTAFSRASRMRKQISALATLIGFRDRWQMEMAAMLSQVGVATLPPAVAARYAAGKGLTPKEEEMIRQLPQLALRVLGDLPRLEEIRTILTHLNDQPDENARPASGTDAIPLGSRLVRVVLEFDVLQSGGLPADAALTALRSQPERYDPDVVADLTTVVANSAGPAPAEVQLRDVTRGMIFADDVRTAEGTLLIARGQEATDGLLERIQTYWMDLEPSSPVRVVAPQPIS